jgi:hypothetical protein
MSVDLDMELDLLERLRPLARGPLPYTVLWHVVTSSSGLGERALRRLREDDRNAGRALELLEEEGLVVCREGRWRPTPAGKRLVWELEKAVSAPPSSVIEGRRLLSVSADRTGGLAGAERLLARYDADILHADGTYELIAILPDDYALVRDLREQLRAQGHRVSATRIVSGP